MAITRLTDIITVFDSKWTYGDVKFGYDGEVNQDHDTKYPLMLVNPPESIIPEIYNGREEYAFEINFYNLYSQAAQSVVTLQKRWDNLQDLSNEWLDLVLKTYQDVTVEVYLNDESIEIERIKDTNNDKLVQIKLIFTMSSFTKCFRPVSNYPSDFSDLVIWLRADSGVTFDIPTKRVSAWADGSGNSNDVAQATASKQPSRIGYGGINDKAYIDFNGTSSSFISDALSPITENFTIFEVSKINNSPDPIIGYAKTGGGKLWMGLNLGKYYATVVDDGNEIELVAHTSVVTTGNNHIAILKKHNKRIDLEYYDSANSLSETDNDSGFNHSLTFNGANFYIGSYVDVAGTFSLEGNISEVIVYNRALTDKEISDVKGYLNLKYKIY
tara:strand:+ start:2545 stop:3699 length:1155 start_codon:yes stop_codon:yes gene_type:complete